MTLDELKAFFSDDESEYTGKWKYERRRDWRTPADEASNGIGYSGIEADLCTDNVLALIAEADRLQNRVNALESSGAAAFNAWRTSSDVIGAMHVLREVVGAEFVDGQRLKK